MASILLGASLPLVVTTALPPVGFYLAHEVGRLAGVSGDRIGQWARRGYIRSSQSTGRPRLYSYQDVAEAMVVHELLDRGFVLRSIKVTIEALREKYGGWPLQAAPLLVEGSLRVMVVENGELFEISRQRMTGSGVVKYAVLDLQHIAQDLHRGGWAARKLSDLSHIEVSPTRLSGRPTIKGKRIEARFVAETAQTDEGKDILVRDYELSEAEIRDAIRWWAVAGEYEAA